jgi:hypothetical protein
MRLYSNAAGTQEVANRTSGQVSVAGTDVAFNDMLARVVRVDISGVTGTFYGSKVASLAEVEVIASGNAISSGGSGCDVNGDMIVNALDLLSTSNADINRDGRIRAPSKFSTLPDGRATERCGGQVGSPRVSEGKMAIESLSGL